jgi:hypothetical protein
MGKVNQLFCLAISIVLFSCQQERVYPYAIKDFRKPLQPHLIKIVSTGTVGQYFIPGKMLKDKDLVELTESEHPVLRGTAFNEIFKRESFNHYNVLMAHLDDTAMILVDNGEFGISSITVSDYILGLAEWDTRESKYKTVEKVLKKHNYLRSACTVLYNLEPQEKYYSVIKDLATHPRKLDYDNFEMAFDEIEYALYGLAKFKKKEDVQIIKQVLAKNGWHLGHLSFRLIKEYPDTAYMQILRDYHRNNFYLFTGKRRNGFSGYTPDRAEPEDFINALAALQNQHSANLLDTILNNLDKYECMPDKESIKEHLVMTIWKQQTPAYFKLKEKVRNRAEQMAKNYYYPDEDRNPAPRMAEEGPFRWYR